MNRRDLLTDALVVPVIVDELDEPLIPKELKRLPEFVADVPVSRVERLELTFKGVNVVKREGSADRPPTANRFLQLDDPSPCHENSIVTPLLPALGRAGIELAPHPGDVGGAGRLPEFGPPGQADDKVIVEWIANKLRAGKPWDGIVQARADIGQRFNIDVKPGTPEAKRVDELIERGVVLEARRLIQIGRDAGTSSAGIYDALVKLYQLQPSLNVRTSTSMLQQAYSTPVPLAFVASELAGIGPGVSVYEPTAGNGMLLIGADVNTTQANELNDARADALEAAGFKTTRNDATKYVPGKELFDVVIENPPFGTVKDENANQTVWHDAPLIGRTPNIDHAIVLRSLEALKPDGRAVLIVGGKIGDEQRRSVAYRGREVSSFYFHLYNNYNVIDHFTVSGDLYKKQGAGFPVDVIVIQGRKKSARQLPAVDVPRVIESWEALGKMLYDRPNPAGVVSRTGHSQSQAPSAGNRPEPGGDRTDDADGGSGILRPRNRPHGGAGGAKPGTGVSRGQPNRQSKPDVQRDVGSQGTGVDGPAPVPAPSGPPEVPPATEPVSAEPPPAPPADGDNAPRLDRTPVANRANVADENLLQVTYTPGAKQAPALGTLTPRNMAAPIEKAIERLMARSKAKSLEDFVATQMGWPLDRVLSSFSAEQVDALALAIDNSMRGKALVLGDQTGMGKGRVVGAMLLWAEKQGFVPVFVTERPNLYADILRDLDDIGARGYQLLPTNSDLTGKNAVPLPNGGTLESLPNPAVAMREAFENHRAGNGLVAVGESMGCRCVVATDGVHLGHGETDGCDSGGGEGERSNTLRDRQGCESGP